LLRRAAGTDLEVEKLRQQFWAPPPTVDEPAPPRWSEQEEGAAWKQAAAATSNVPGVRVSAG
jgi:hypothetical protein